MSKKDPKDTVGYWANKYGIRLLLVLMYKSGEMTLDEIIATEEFKYKDDFLRFVEIQMESGRKFKNARVTNTQP